MAIILDINYPKLKDAVWGHGKAIAKRLNINPIQFSKKLNRKAVLRIEEFNTIMIDLGLNAKDFISFTEVDSEEEVEGCAA